MRAWRDALLFHLFIAAAAVGVFFTLRPPELGWGILGLVAVYNLLLPLIASRSGHRDWLELWLFLLPLSVLQVLPDWVLTQQFASSPSRTWRTAYRRGAGLHGGMWVIPLFWILWLAGRSTLTAAVLALLVFAGAEWAAHPLQLCTRSM